MDEWLTNHLIDTGVLNADGVTRKARARRCGECNRRTLVGLDGDRAAGVAIVDCDEIDRIGEVMAVARGLPTYTLRKTGGRWEIDYRHPIEMSPDRPWPVYPKHVCGVFYPKVAMMHPRLLREFGSAVRMRTTTSDEPPF